MSCPAFLKIKVVAIIMSLYHAEERGSSSGAISVHNPVPCHVGILPVVKKQLPRHDHVILNFLSSSF